jgi:hypothetical protein
MSRVFFQKRTKITADHVKIYKIGGIWRIYIQGRLLSGILASAYDDSCCGQGGKYQTKDCCGVHGLRGCLGFRVRIGDGFGFFGGFAAGYFIGYRDLFGLCGKCNAFFLKIEYIFAQFASQ